MSADLFLAEAEAFPRADGDAIRYEQSRRAGTTSSFGLGRQPTPTLVNNGAVRPTSSILFHSTHLHGRSHVRVYSDRASASRSHHGFRVEATRTVGSTPCRPVWPA